MAFPKCKGCGYQRTEEDAQAPLLTCTSCGIPYAWSNTELPSGYAASKSAPSAAQSHNPTREIERAEGRAQKAPRQAQQQQETSRADPQFRQGRYVSATLSNGEEVLFVASLHWIIYVPGAVLLMLSLLAMLGGSAGDRESAGSPLMLGLALVLLGRAALLQYTTEMAITTKRVVGKTGFIRRETLDLNHNRVESYSVNQSVLGRALNYGSVSVRGTGSGYTTFRAIADPLAYRRAAAEVADQAG